MTHDSRLANEFGPINIYLFDQLLRGRITSGMSVLDCGCGGGRNLRYLLRNGFEVMGVDRDPRAIAAIQQLAAELAPSLSTNNFRAESVESMSVADTSVDVVLSSAVLHFARDEQQFGAMLSEMWRVLRPGGLFFCRLASSIGMEGRFRPIDGRVHELLDGSVRFLVDEALLMDWTARLGGALLDPLKTTVVQNQRCMTTWVMRKNTTPPR